VTDKSLKMSRQNKFPNLEFRWVDGAWYDVSVRLVGSCLHVHYRGFSKAFFNCLEDVDGMKEAAPCC
jgi:hypothetical protein